MSITTVMTGLEGLSPTYDSNVTVNVWAYNAQKDTLNESECPVRMIGRADDKQGAVLEVRNLGNKAVATWEILDRVYIFPVMLDQGTENYNHKILDYMDSYMAVAKSGQCIANGVHIVNVDFSAPFTRPYPDVEGAPVFWVVDAVVTVEEYR